MRTTPPFLVPFPFLGLTRSPGSTTGVERPGTICSGPYYVSGGRGLGLLAPQTMMVEGRRGRGPPEDRKPGRGTLGTLSVYLHLYSDIGPRTPGDLSGQATGPGSVGSCV